MAPLIATGRITRPSYSAAGRNTSRGTGSGASSVGLNRRLPMTTTTTIFPRPFSVVTAATKTIVSKPSSSAVNRIGTKLIGFAKDKQRAGRGNGSTIIVPAGADSNFVRRLVFSLLRAGKSVIAGAFFWKKAIGMHDNLGVKWGDSTRKNKQRARERDGQRQERGKEEKRRARNGLALPPYQDFNPLIFLSTSK